LDFAATDLQRTLREEALALGHRFPLEWWAEHDRSGEYPTDFVKTCAERGWLGLLVP